MFIPSKYFLPYCHPINYCLEIIYVKFYLPKITRKKVLNLTCVLLLHIALPHKPFFLQFSLLNFTYKMLKSQSTFFILLRCDHILLSILFSSFLSLILPTLIPNTVLTHYQHLHVIFLIPFICIPVLFVIRDLQVRSTESSSNIIQKNLMKASTTNEEDQYSVVC